MINQSSMFDRNDDYLNQQGDGYAAYIAGIKSQVMRTQTEMMK